MDELKILKHLNNLEEKEECSLGGNLICTCGNNFFSIYFKGIQTKGVFAPNLIRNNGILLINGICSNCGKKLKIYSSISRLSLQRRAKIITKKVSIPLLRFGTQPYKIKLMYNYFQEKYKTNDFDMIFIEVYDSSKNKWIRIVED